jgi:hypothetical protein
MVCGGLGVYNNSESCWGDVYWSLKDYWDIVTQDYAVKLTSIARKWFPTKEEQDAAKRNPLSISFMKDVFHEVCSRI